MPPKKWGPKQPAAPAPAAAQSAPAPAAVKAAPPMRLVTRSKEGIHLWTEDGPASLGEQVAHVGGDVAECELAFSADGALVAFATAEKACVMDTATGAIVAEVPEAGVSGVQFSPDDRLLTTFRAQDRKVANDQNMAFWSLADLRAGKAPEPLLRCGQGAWPATWWAADASFFVRRTTGLLSVHDGTLERKEAVDKFEVQLPRNKEALLAACPAAALPFCALFLPQHKGTMGTIRIFRLPHVSEELLNRSFARADDATLAWSKSGAALTAIIKSDTDKSGQSYYGTAVLCVLNVRDRESYNVALPSGDTIHDCQWSPTADEFIVIHGQMPRNKATLYNARAEAIYSFGEAPRNTIGWAPNGKLFFLGGTGNLAGDFQMYDRTVVQAGKTVSGDGKLGFFNEKSSVQCWAPDSRHVIIKNVFSRLRLDNKFALYSHSGEARFLKKFAELYTAAFVPQPHRSFPERPLEAVAVQQQAVKPQAYRPPGGGSAGAAAILQVGTAGGIGNAVKPKSSGPVGAVVADPKKKKGGRR